MTCIRRLLVPVPLAMAPLALAAGPIQDNSFLIEEAYNQEAGVVQFIQSFTQSRGSWNYSFTNEIPLGGERHQFAYTIPVSRQDPLTGTELADVTLHYRFEAARTDTMRLTPRLSAILPTGTGSFGLQAALAASVEISPAFVMHWNLGATWTPDAKIGFNHGASLVWLTSQDLNFLVEFVGSGSETISPGLRYAINLPGDFQIVPGVAVPVTVGSSSTDASLLGYLSIEGKLW